MEDSVFHKGISASQIKQRFNAILNEFSRVWMGKWVSIIWKTDCKFINKNKYIKIGRNMARWP